MPDQGKNSFYCPECGQKLSFLGGQVLKLAGRLHAETFSCKTMFYIPAKLGDYGAIVGEGVRLHDGTKVEFECINGACKKNLTAPYDDGLAEIKMVDQQGREYIVVFNKLYGRRETILLDFQNREFLQSYGEDLREERMRNYFGS